MTDFPQKTLKQILLILSVLISISTQVLGQRRPNSMEEFTRGQLAARTFSKQEDEKEFKGLVAGVHHGNHDFFELGYCRSASSLGFLMVATSASTEWNFKDKVGGYKMGIWVNSILSAGINTVVYYNYNQYSMDYKKMPFGFRPEVGIGFSIINLIYGYNLLIVNPRTDGVNKHMISARIVLPVAKVKTNEK